MNITLVTDTYTPDINGAALSLERLTRALLKLGHHISVIHTGPSNHPYEISVPGFYIPFCKSFKTGFPAYFKLRNRWKKERPDIIYVAIESFLGASAMIAARKLNIPVVAGFHTNFHQYLKRYFIPQIERPTLALLRKIHNYCDASIVPSQYTHNTLKKQGFNNLYVIGRGVNVSKFNPAKRSTSLRATWGVNDDDRVIIIVGRIAKEKNLDTALQAITDLNIDADSIQKTHTIIVGEGALKKTLSEKFSQPEFHWAGLKKGDELATYYASADIMFFTSETETFGNVIPEALASGLITVAYDYAAASNLIIDTENGYKAPIGNITELTTKLKIALANEDHTSMKTLARQSTIQLTWADIADQFAETLKEIATNQFNSK